MLATSGDAPALLNESINRKTVYERLHLAFGVPDIDPQTQLVHTTAERRAVGFIFCDSICMTVDLLMASLLRHCAAGHLAFFAEMTESTAEAEAYSALAGQIAQNILPVFGSDAHSDGWLKAEQGLVWECIGWGRDANQNPGVTPSITLPLGGLG